MYWTVTLNAAVDHIDVLALAAGDYTGVARRSEHVSAGKGVNVSRALASMGATSVAVVLCDGIQAAEYRRALAALGACCRALPLRALTRHHSTLIDPDSSTQLHAREPGEPCRPEWEESISAALDDVRPGDHVALSGSLPPGLDAGLYGRLITRLKARRCLVWLDVSGQPLAQALAARPHAIKVNATEAGELLGCRVSGVEDAARAVRHLLRMGVERAGVTLGATGMVYGDATGVAWAASPVEHALSSVGSGDAALAALMLATERGTPVIEAARSAAAAGAANARTLVPGRFAATAMAEALASAEARELA